MARSLEMISEARCFGGWQRSYRHRSVLCNSAMRFAVYLPPAAENTAVPALYWLSGLTCTEDNFSTKAGAQRYAAELGLALIIPDTSPRGLGLPGEEDDWDFGSGAGFYLTATEPPWAGHYDMYGYVAEELPGLVESELPLLPDVRSISGHSMGGHGALTIGLKQPERYRSISAFAPICAPMRSPWGRKAFSRYLGEDHTRWRDYDATWLAAHQPSNHELLIDQGSADPWLAEQLLPQEFTRACQESGQALRLRMQPGYEHGYYFVSSFIGEHLRFHHAALTGA